MEANMEKFEKPLGRIISEFAIKIGIGSSKKTEKEYMYKYNKAHDECVFKIKKLFLERITNNI